MKIVRFVYLMLLLASLDAFANSSSRKPASALTLADLKPSAEKQVSDQEEIKKKMFQPAKLPNTSSKSVLRMEATCTDARRITRTSSDPLYKDCLEERPRVAKPPMDNASPNGTTFGVSILK